jgi:hypothetical protein
LSGHPLQPWSPPHSPIAAPRTLQPPPWLPHSPTSTCDGHIPLPHILNISSFFSFSFVSI